ncbi:MAG: Gfo/Idh/MocA family oxidoreductase [Pirellulaceae bacterium]|nr:Gfo/Idh/MocA family oxidoreductase [Planctomycetales bacterium]
MKKLRMAVVGVGHLGRIHARLIADMPDVQLVTVVDPDPIARDHAHSLCDFAAREHFQDLVGLVDAAVIATPTHGHCQAAQFLLDHGIHVLVEKPLAATSAEALRILEAAQRSQAILQVGHIERFNPAWVAARPFLHDARYFQGHRSSTYTFRSTDVSVVLDLMIHDIDLVLSATASHVIQTDAMGISRVGENEDWVQARLHLANGCVADLFASRVSTVAQRTMQAVSCDSHTLIDFASRTATVVNAHGAAEIDATNVEQLSADQRNSLRDSFFELVMPRTDLDVPQCNALADELRDFVDCIRHRTAPQVTGHDGHHAVMIAEQIHEAVQQHQWDRSTTGRIGPHFVPPAPILRPPHWTDPAQPRRKAG